jgi:hypothetical protein
LKNKIIIIGNRDKINYLKSLILLGKIFFFLIVKNRFVNKITVLEMVINLKHTSLRIIIGFEDLDCHIKNLLED